jgi:hypothetical protein
MMKNSIKYGVLVMPMAAALLLLVSCENLMQRLAGEPDNGSASGETITVAAGNAAESLYSFRGTVQKSDSDSIGIEQAETISNARVPRILVSQ